jgi:hypothetical protein
MKTHLNDCVRIITLAVSEMFKTSTLSFSIEDSEIVISCCMGWMSRPHIIGQMFGMYIADRNIQYLPQINIDLSDASTDMDNFPEVQYLSISATIPNKHLLIPDPYSLCWPEAKIDNVFATCMSIAGAGSIPPTDKRIFWIGQNSHWTRQVVVEMATKYPDKINAKWLEWKNDTIPQECMVSLEEHTKYKYLIDLSGQGFSARIKYLMFSRRPLFIVDRAYHDWISCDLLPWVHFIPVSESNLESDLLMKLEWAEKNEDKARNIANNAYEYIAAKLTLDNIFDRIDTALKQITLSQ